MEECNSNSKNYRLLRLRCSVQNCDWGIVGENSLVGRLFSLNSGSGIIDPDKQYSEFWIGTHESGSSFVNEAREFGEAVTLKSWISRNPNVLGNEVLNKWGCDLPFLFKVLSVGRALSRQSHPDKELAETLHELQPNICKDGNHKLEMALALTEFEALYGFIGLKELKDVLCGVPEIVELIGKADAEQVLRANEHVGEEKVKAVLEFIFTQLMSSNKDTISELIFKIKPRLNMEKETRKLTDT